MKRILIVDDNQRFRQAIKTATSNNERMSIVGECTDGDEVLSFLSQFPVDVILMDIQMKRLGGIEATKLVKEKYPSIKVIALTSHDESIFKKKMKEAGASGYLLKGGAIEVLEECVSKT